MFNLRGAEMALRASCLSGTHSTVELHPRACFSILVAKSLIQGHHLLSDRGQSVQVHFYQDLWPNSCESQRRWARGGHNYETTFLTLGISAVYLEWVPASEVHSPYLGDTGSHQG